MIVGLLPWPNANVDADGVDSLVHVHFDGSSESGVSNDLNRTCTVERLYLELLPSLASNMFRCGT